MVRGENKHSRRENTHRKRSPLIGSAVAAERDSTSLSHALDRRWLLGIKTRDEN
jgi:hypothetical protein